MLLNDKKPFDPTKRPPWMTPPIHGEDYSQMMAQPMPATPAQEKGGFFAKNGAWRDVLGSIFDIISAGSGGPTRYWDDKAALADRVAAEKLAQQKREAELQDYETKKRIDRSYEAPPSPYRWRNNNGDLMELGPDGQPRVAYDDPQDKVNWIQVKDPATGAIQIVPMGPSGMMGGSLPPGLDPDEWEPYEGDAGSNVSGGFRSPY